MHSELAWSCISNRPVIVHLKSHDTEIAYWHGVVMTKRQALAIAGSIYLNHWVSDKAKDAMWDEFKKLYYSNAFQSSGDWEVALESVDGGRIHFRSLTNKIKRLHEKIKLESPYEMFSWFTKDVTHYVD
jgi:hypothetical protein